MQFWQDFAAKALLLVIPTELEILWQDFAAKALVWLNPTVVLRNSLTKFALVIQKLYCSQIGPTLQLVEIK